MGQFYPNINGTVTHIVMGQFTYVIDERKMGVTVPYMKLSNNYMG